MPAASPTKTRRLSASDTLALWKKYDATGDPALRDRLVLTFAPLVKYLVYKKVREMPANSDVEDLISCGLEAVIQSVDRYDPAKGATLEQYAWTRIHGAILDQLRRQDWAPRSVRRWERDMEKARDAFLTLHGRHPSDPELADALGTTLQELRLRRGEIARSEVTSLNTMVQSEDQTTIERLDTIVSEDERLDPLRAAAGEEAKGKFRAAFGRLSRREREVAVMLYVKNLTLAEIGEVIGVSESRVCQIHGSLKARLRSQLDADAQLFQAIA
jgi:RNA polymerase sigma factor for flagellar operon FliA